MMEYFQVSIFVKETYGINHRPRERLESKQKPTLFAMTIIPNYVYLTKNHHEFSLFLNKNVLLVESNITSQVMHYPVTSTRVEKNKLTEDLSLRKNLSVVYNF